MVRIPSAFWSVDIPALLHQLRTTPDGLGTAEARARLVTFSANRPAPRKRTSDGRLLLSQFQSPILLLLLFAAALSFFLHDPTDAIIILTILGASGLLGFWQERGASRAVERLLEMVEVRATFLRDGRAVQLSTVELVPGDVILLGAGSVIPADCRVLESRDLFVAEAAFTGEPYPVEKAAATLPAETRLAQRTNALFLGTHVVSGQAKAVVVRTGKQTEFGEISKRLRARPAQTDFERGVGVAIRPTAADRIGKSDETRLTLLGLIVVFDPPRPDAADAVRDLAALGISTAIISGDNALVATYVARQIGMAEPRVLTGAALEKLDDRGIVRRVTNVDIFAEIEPAQKERIIAALRRAGRVVGYLGDGINDAPALRAADVGISELAIAGDRVDPEMVERPRRWDVHVIRRFMLAFGLLSSVFDYATFAVLLLVLNATTELFRTGWLIESVVSAAMIVLVIRSRRPFFRTRPARRLLLATLGIVAAALALPYTPLAGPLELRPLPPPFLFALAGILALYVAGAELMKHWFYGRAGRSTSSPQGTSARKYA